MTQNYIFNYAQFYNYYTNPNNIITNKNNCVSLRYFASNKEKLSRQTESKCDYIIINNVQIYVSKSKKYNVYKDISGNKIVEEIRTLQFTIPTLIDGILFDFHYHFGARTEPKYIPITDKQYISDVNINNFKNKTNLNSKTKKCRKERKTYEYCDLEMVEPVADQFNVDPNKKLIFFHKTVQIVSSNNEMGVNKHINCYFQDNTHIQSINNIVCIDEDKTVMGKLLSQHDKDILAQIMSQPFAKNIGRGIKKCSKQKCLAKHKTRKNKKCNKTH